MFTIGEGDNHDPKSPGNSGVTTESIFSGPTPSNFWIVTSFVIPNDLKNKDWWVVAFIDEHGNVVEGFKEFFDIFLLYVWILINSKPSLLHGSMGDFVKIFLFAGGSPANFSKY